MLQRLNHRPGVVFVIPYSLSLDRRVWYNQTSVFHHEPDRGAYYRCIQKWKIVVQAETERWHFGCIPIVAKTVRNGYDFFS
jgi:hypothetical protein